MRNILITIVAAILTTTGSAAHSETLIKCLDNKFKDYSITTQIMLIDDANQELFITSLLLMNGDLSSEDEAYGNSHEEAVSFIRYYTAKESGIIFWHQDLIAYTDVDRGAYYYDHSKDKDKYGNFSASISVLDRAKGTLSTVAIANHNGRRRLPQMAPWSSIGSHTCEIWNGKNNKF